MVVNTMFVFGMLALARCEMPLALSDPISLLRAPLKLLFCWTLAPVKMTNLVWLIFEASPIVAAVGLWRGARWGLVSSRVIALVGLLICSVTVLLAIRRVAHLLSLRALDQSDYMNLAWQF